MSISFIVPKIDQPYQLQHDYTLRLMGIDSVGQKRLIKKGVAFPLYSSLEFILGAGGIFKILTWFPMVPYMKIRIIDNPNKPYEKFNAYVEELDTFLREIKVEEISV